jgi:hypothetical protein
MGLDSFLDPGQFTTQDAESEIESDPCEWPLGVSAQVTEAVADQVQGDFSHVLRRAAVLEVGVEFDFGATSGVEVFTQRSDFGSDVALERIVENMLSVMNGNFQDRVILHLRQENERAKMTGQGKSIH